MRSTADILRFVVYVFLLCGAVVLTSTFPSYVLRSSAQPKSPEATAPATAPSEGAPAESTAPTPIWVWDWVMAHPWIVGGCLAAIVVGGGGILLYRSGAGGPNPKIEQLGPSFFFWLAIVYMALLLLLG